MKLQVLKVCLCNRLLVEKIFAQNMVPHSLETEEKMKCLYYLYACLDTNAVKWVLIDCFKSWSDCQERVSGSHLNVLDSITVHLLTALLSLMCLIISSREHLIVFQSTEWNVEVSEYVERTCSRTAGLTQIAYSKLHKH